MGLIPEVGESQIGREFQTLEEVGCRVASSPTLKAKVVDSLTDGIEISLQLMAIT
jgi:hypothetical protein